MRWQTAINSLPLFTMNALVPYELSKEQVQSVMRMSETTSQVFINWWKMGTGKTRLALTVFFLSEFTDMIVVTRRIAFGDWVDEMKKCGLDFLVYENDYSMGSILNLAHAKKRMLLLSAGDLANRPRIPTGQLLIVDELYLFSNPKAKRTKMLHDFSLSCRSRVGLSGTIMPARDNITIFGQLYALNAHRVLADTPTKFRSLYQDAMKTRFGRKTVNKEGSEVAISNKLAFMVDLNFPESRPTTEQILKVNRTTEQTKAINSLLELYEWDNKEYDYASQVCHAINGLSNGWWIDNNSNLSFRKSTKAERLYILLDDLVSAGNRVVVWCAYHNDIARISSELKHSWCEFSGKAKFDKKGWDAGKYDVVLATEGNGASVNHFGNVQYCIYFSIDYKALNLEQSKTRHERKSSTHDGAHYYFLQTKGTLDARIFALVTESQLTEKEFVGELIKELNNCQ